MAMNNIIHLQEVAQNSWKAKYRGNYGVYTVKITFGQGGEISDFSCSCPSSYYPCKHIPIVEKAIDEQIVKCQRLSADTSEKPSTVEQLLNAATFQELRDFVVRQAKYNANLVNAIKLEFTHKITHQTVEENADEINPYSDILRESLENIIVDFESNQDDYYDDEISLDLDEIDRWIEKAQEHIKEKNYTEALLICKACIEEFAKWFQEIDDEVVDYFDSFHYETIPFEMMAQIAASSDVNAKALYNYCRTEMKKNKYAKTSFFDSFNDLLATLAVRINPDEFIASQDSLLEKIEDKSSHEAEKILLRKINFYNETQQPEKAEEILEKNIQIENFRYRVAKKRFAEQKYDETKRLIKEFPMEKHNNQRWNELLLQVAQRENDVPTIRTIAFSFISRHFNRNYFDIYKSTFTPDEWKDVLESLLQYYKEDKYGYNFQSHSKQHYFSSTVADVLIAEGATERLMQYIEKYLSAENVEKYYSFFVDLYPEKTLELFQKAVDNSAKNLGRANYEYIARLLKKMREIKNGDVIVREMISRYRIEYKKRTAMMEILKNL